MADRGLHRHVERFVAQYPSEAVDIILDCCTENVRVYKDVMACLVETGNEGRTPGQLNITYQPAPPQSPDSHLSQRSVSPISREKMSRRPVSFANSSYGPLSPPSSATSRSSAGQTRPGDYVKLLTCHGNTVEESLVCMRIAPILLSVIREGVIDKRNLTDHVVDIVPRYVSVTHSRTPEDPTMAESSQIVVLTWLRVGSEASHKTTFYVVPENSLDTDVLLGFDDSGEEIPVSDHGTTIAPKPQRRQDYMLANLHQSRRPDAPTPPAPSQSYHRSAMMYDASASGTPIQHQQPQNHSHALPTAFMETLLAKQRPNIASHENRQLSHNSPAPTVLGSHPSCSGDKQSLDPSETASIPTYNIPTSAAANRLRLLFQWNKTPMSIWLDLGASGEDFFRSFQQIVEKRKGIFDRANITIYLKTDKSTRDDECFPLSLDVDELEVDWQNAVEWLQENLKEQSSHIYGRVQVGDG